MFLEILPIAWFGQCRELTTMCVYLSSPVQLLEWTNLRHRGRIGSNGSLVPCGCNHYHLGHIYIYQGSISPKDFNVLHSPFCSRNGVGNISPWLQQTRWREVDSWFANNKVRQWRWHLLNTETNADRYGPRDTLDWLIRLNRLITVTLDCEMFGCYHLLLSSWVLRWGSVRLYRNVTIKTTVPRMVAQTPA